MNETYLDPFLHQVIENLKQRNYCSAFLLYVQVL